MPWLPLPETMTTGISQPLMRASLPAAAQARASTLMSSGYSASRVEPMLAPQLLRRPSSATARLHDTCFSSRSETRLTSTVLANSRMSFTLRTLLSVRLSSAESENSFSITALPSSSSSTTLVWLLAMCTRALCSPAQPVSCMSSIRVVSSQTTSMGVLAI